MNRGDNTLPFGDATEEQAEAEQMMREMRSRNFGQLQIDAERERREAQLRKGFFLSYQLIILFTLQLWVKWKRL